MKPARAAKLLPKLQQAISKSITKLPLAARLVQIYSGFSTVDELLEVFLRGTVEVGQEETTSLLPANCTGLNDLAFPLTIKALKQGY